jgi:hypothetical protein
LEDWNSDILEKLLKIRDIEGESFDFKREVDDKLYNDICAMANSNGGYLVLGIDENKTLNGILLDFKKHGFKYGEEDKIKLSISNSFHNVEPLPQITIKLIVSNKKFYPIIKIEVEEYKKPFFIKEKGQCYIRVGNSSRPASRSVILNLMQRHLVSREEQRNHTNYLKPIIQQLSAITVIADREFRLRLNVPDNYTNYRMGILALFNRELEEKYPFRYVKLEDVRHMDWVLSHLRSNDYSAVYQNFGKVLELLQRYNKTVHTTYQYLEKGLTDLIDTYFSDFVIDEFQKTKLSKKSIDIHNILRFFFPQMKYFFQYNSPVNFKQMTVTKSDFDNFWYLEIIGHGLTMKANEEEQLEPGKLTELLNTMFRNNKVRAKFTKLVEKEKEIEKIIKQIKKDLELLIVDLEGGELIKGYCKLGY